MQPVSSGDSSLALLPSVIGSSDGNLLILTAVWFPSSGEYRGLEPGAWARALISAITVIYAIKLLVPGLEPCCELRSSSRSNRIGSTTEAAKRDSVDKRSTIPWTKFDVEFFFFFFSRKQRRWDRLVGKTSRNHEQEFVVKRSVPGTDSIMKCCSMISLQATCSNMLRGIISQHQNPVPQQASAGYKAQSTNRFG